MRTLCYANAWDLVLVLVCVIYYFVTNQFSHEFNFSRTHFDDIGPITAPCLLFEPCVVAGVYYIQTHTRTCTQTHVYLRVYMDRQTLSHTHIQSHSQRHRYCANSSDPVLTQVCEVDRHTHTHAIDTHTHTHAYLHVYIGRQTRRRTHKHRHRHRHRYFAPCQGFGPCARAGVCYRQTHT